MTSRTLVLRSVARTRALGRKLGGLLRPGDFVGLEGDLGAGKTELVRALCAGAGVDLAQVSSPTFAIVAEYRGGRLPIYHADLYRLADDEELYATGFFDLVGGPGAAVVEWIDRVPTAAPPGRLWVRLRHTGPTTRELTATAEGARYEELLAAWLGPERKPARRKPAARKPAARKRR